MSISGIARYRALLTAMDKPPSAGTRTGRRAPLAAGLFLLAVAGAGLFGFWLAGGEITSILPFGLSADDVAAKIRSWGASGVIGSLLLMAVHSFVPFPAELVAIANGMVFGVVMGTAITWSGAMLGAMLAFALARWLGRPFVHAILAHRHAAAIDQWTMQQGAGILLISRFLPVVSFNMINYAAGLTSVSWWTFLWTTGLGILPLTFLMVLTGNQMISGHGKLAVATLVAGIGASLLWVIIARRQRGAPPTVPPH
jgi:uncharacterized membrane protein YdjX (TVP38/TMEM64 family)